MTSAPVTLEREIRSANGYLAAAVGAGLIVLMVVSFIVAPVGGPWSIIPRVVLIALGVFILVGLYMLQPREAAILTLFGLYRHRPQRRPALGQPAVRQAPHLAARAQPQRPR
jgi:hypothetical protein